METKLEFSKEFISEHLVINHVKHPTKQDYKMSGWCQCLTYITWCWLGQYYNMYFSLLNCLINYARGLPSCEHFLSFSLVFDRIGCFREYFWKMYLLRHIAVLTQLPTAKLWLKWFYIISIYICTWLLITLFSSVLQLKSKIPSWKPGFYN